MSLSILRTAACLFLLTLGLPAWSHDGHDHDEPPAARPSGDAPQRLPDGSLFLPKPAQRQLAVRTLPVQPANRPRARELAGKVVMDPNAGGKVQALIAGRVQAGPNGLPSVGKRVSKDEILAYVLPGLAGAERIELAARQGELRAARALADKRVARLRELSDTVPRKELEAAIAELSGLDAQLRALDNAGVARDTLRAPVAGVIASSTAFAGQVVDARELLFEIVDPARLQIEVLAYEPALARDVAGATLALGEQRVPLRFVGAARSLREQALPMLFAGEHPALAQLAVGQPVKVFVYGSQTLEGLAVPATALVKNAANQDIVWVKREAERFEPRVVTFGALDGVYVAIESGLQSGDRVVTRGASLINQIR